MPKKTKRFYEEDPSEDEDKFETEALSFLNEKSEDRKHKHFGDSDSDLDLTDSEDDREEINQDRVYEKEDRQSEDDDEAPESVGFSDSRLSALTQLRSAMKQIDSEKHKKKSLRKKVDEQYKEQKAKKLSDLSKSKLPADFLESLDEPIPNKKAKKQKLETKVVGKKKKKQASGTDDDVLDDLDRDDDVMSLPVGAGEDFISLTDSASGVQVMDVRKIDHVTKNQAQKAADFRHSRLYGSQIRRESNKDRLAKKEKRRHRLR